jgi:hypothetical protein
MRLGKAKARHVDAQAPPDNSGIFPRAGSSTFQKKAGLVE